LSTAPASSQAGEHRAAFRCGLFLRTFLFLGSCSMYNKFDVVASSNPAHSTASSRAAASCSQRAPSQLDLYLFLAPSHIRAKFNSMPRREVRSEDAHGPRNDNHVHTDTALLRLSVSCTHVHVHEHGHVHVHEHNTITYTGVDWAMMIPPRR
jgi:hypothetical protein